MPKKYSKLPRQTVWLDDRGRLTVPAYLLEAAKIEKPSFVTVEADPNLEGCKILILMRGY